MQLAERIYFYDTSLFVRAWLDKRENVQNLVSVLQKRREKWKYGPFTWNGRREVTKYVKLCCVCRSKIREHDMLTVGT